MTGPWPALVVRPDDSPGVGAGHVMRTLALVERWSPTGPAVVALRSTDSPFASRVRAAGGRVVVAAGTEEDAGLGPIIEREAPAWVVLDGYGFGRPVQARVRATGTRVAVIDDHGHHGGYEADLVLDQNLGTTPEAVAARPDGAAALLGPRYALLRNEFRRVPPEPDGRTPTVVVTLGGFAADCAEALADTLTAELADRHLEVQATTPVRAGATAAMAGLLAGATVVVSAAGSTAWELCGLGRPAVLVAVAPNQEPVGAALEDAGAARYLGRLDDLGPGVLADTVAALLVGRDTSALAARAGALVDGRGADRVVAELRSSLVDLRPVAADDCRLLWEWANDPAVRASAWSPAPIPWEDHVHWWETPPTRPRHHYVAIHGDRPWAQVRFDVGDNGVAEIDVSVAASCRGQQAAAPLLRAGVRRLFADGACVEVRASIRPENERSVRAFLAADFSIRSPASANPADGGCTLTYIRGRDGRP